MKDTRQALLEAIEHAPQAGKIAADLRGWWTPAGWYVCANCASRIVGRGCQLPKGSEPVWADRAEPFGVCATCEAPPYTHRGSPRTVSAQDAGQFVHADGLSHND